MKVLSAVENVRNAHTTGFSRVVLQLQARGAAGLVTLWIPLTLVVWCFSFGLLQWRKAR